MEVYVKDEHFTEYIKSRIDRIENTKYETGNDYVDPKPSKYNFCNSTTLRKKRIFENIARSRRRRKKMRKTAVFKIRNVHVLGMKGSIQNFVAKLQEKRYRPNR